MPRISKSIRTCCVWSYCFYPIALLSAKPNICFIYHWTKEVKCSLEEVVVLLKDSKIIIFKGYVGILQKDYRLFLSIEHLYAVSGTNKQGE